MNLVENEKIFDSVEAYGNHKGIFECTVTHINFYDKTAFQVNLEKAMTESQSSRQIYLVTLEVILYPEGIILWT